MAKEAGGGRVISPAENGHWFKALMKGSENTAKGIERFTPLRH